MARILRQDAERLLGDVPGEYAFKCCDGGVFRNMRELGIALNNMTDETFAYHSNESKSDFSNWVADLVKDEKLARDLRKSVDRVQAAKSVEKRIAFLQSKLV
jgi:hypothetical protein